MSEEKEFIFKTTSEEKTILPFKLCENTVIVSAGGLDIKVTGCNITFTISQNNWQMSVAELESMLESHQLLKDACKQITTNILISGDSEKQQITHTQIEDGIELHNGIRSALEALRRAD